MSKQYTPEQQELFSKIGNTFNRLNMNGQGDATEKVNFKKGELSMMKKDGKVMIENKGIMKPFGNLASLEKFLDENMEYYMNKINGKMAHASTEELLKSNGIEFKNGRVNKSQAVKAAMIVRSSTKATAGSGAIKVEVDQKYKDYFSNYNNLKSTLDFLEKAENELEGCPVEWSDDEKCFYIYDPNMEVNPDSLKEMVNKLDIAESSDQTEYIEKMKDQSDSPEVKEYFEEMKEQAQADSGLTIEEKFKILKEYNSWSGGYFPFEDVDNNDSFIQNTLPTNIDSEKAIEFLEDVADNELKPLIPIYEAKTKEFEKIFAHQGEYLAKLKKLSGKPGKAKADDESYHKDCIKEYGEVGGDIMFYLMPTFNHEEWDDEIYDNFRERLKAEYPELMQKFEEIMNLAEKNASLWADISDALKNDSRDGLGDMEKSQTETEGKIIELVKQNFNLPHKTAKADEKEEEYDGELTLAKLKTLSAALVEVQNSMKDGMHDLNLAIQNKDLTAIKNSANIKKLIEACNNAGTDEAAQILWN
jgi:hypothetical protein